MELGITPIISSGMLFQVRIDKLDNSEVHADWILASCRHPLN